MRNIQVPTRDQVDAKSQTIFDNLKKGLGMVPNLYATIGYSSNTLGAYLDFAGAIGKGVFSNKEQEAIKLIVSEVNNCQYCKAAHTMLGKMAGFTEEETIEIRSGSYIGDQKLSALVVLAGEIAEYRGKASDAAKENFFAQGYDEKALIDLVAVVLEITFTNYAHRLTEVPVDFPAAKELVATA